MERSDPPRLEALAWTEARRGRLAALRSVDRGGEPPNHSVARLVGARRDRRLSRTFAGTYGSTFSATLSPALTGDATANVSATDPRKRMQSLFRDTAYAGLWKALNDFQDPIKVEPGPNGYDPTQKTLQFGPGMIKELTEMAGGSKPFDAPMFGSHLSAIVHEFSHANDHLIKNREFPTIDDVRVQGVQEMPAHVKGMLDTELLAWAREAISASQVATKTGTRPEAARQQLLDAWMHVDPSMMVSSAAIRQNVANEVVNRTLRYTEREFTKLWGGKGQPFVDTKVDAWFTNNTEWLKQRPGDLKVLVQGELA